MLLVVFAIYASTAAYWITVILQAFQQMAEMVDGASFSASQMDKIISVIYGSLDGNPKMTDNGPQGVEVFGHPQWERETQGCVGTASLTTNVRSALLDPLSCLLCSIS